MSSLKSKLTASVKQAKASTGKATPQTQTVSSKARTEAVSAKPQKRPETSKRGPSSINSSVNANVVASHRELFPSRVWPD
jgi:hypothetical protein